MSNKHLNHDDLRMVRGGMSVSFCNNITMTMARSISEHILYAASKPVSLQVKTTSTIIKDHEHKTDQ